MLAQGRKTIPKRGVMVRLGESFKFWWAPTISGTADRLMCMHVIDSVGRSVW